MYDTKTEIEMECDEIKEMLLDKNKRYGDSALNPIRVFSQCNKLEQIKVRMDDKLTRIMSATDDDYEDAVNDLIGYLILYQIARKRLGLV